MNALTRLAAGAVFATALSGAALFASSPAMADSDRTDCTGNSCVHVHCYDDGSCDRTTSERDVYDPAGFAPVRKPLRYACDEYGNNCHYTRSYYFDDDGQAVYDPQASP